MQFQRGNICVTYSYTYFTLVLYKNQVAYNGEEMGII